jgi:bifunctional N-acetylglucosamine-1-phosphate-uridyltransferase/glucosamine-1-phosphate-acetyltransferase GlmU-like protein
MVKKTSVTSYTRVERDYIYSLYRAQNRATFTSTKEEIAKKVAILTRNRKQKLTWREIRFIYPRSLYSRRHIQYGNPAHMRWDKIKKGRNKVNQFKRLNRGEEIDKRKFEARAITSVSSIVMWTEN